MSLLASSVGAPQPEGAPRSSDPGVCVLVSSGREEFNRVANTVASSALDHLKTPATRIDAERFSDASALQRACRRVAITIGTSALKAANAALDDTPVVYTLAPSLEAATSGDRRMHGVSAHADPGAVLHTLQRIVPAAKKIGVVYDPRRTGQLVALAARIAETRDMEVVALAAESTGEAIKAFHRFENDISVDALWILQDTTTTTPETWRYALELALWRRVPAIAPSRGYVAHGALFALECPPERYGRMAAAAARRLLAKERAPSLQYAPSYVPLLNLRTADRLELRLPSDLVKEAGELIR